MDDLDCRLSCIAFSEESLRVLGLLDNQRNARDLSTDLIQLGITKDLFKISDSFSDLKTLILLLPYTPPRD